MIDKVYDSQVCRWLEQNREQLVTYLMELMRIPSVRGTAESGAPYGASCQSAIAAAEDLFRSLGFDTRMEADRGYALAFSGSDEKCIGIFGHADVVPPGDGWIHTQPFEPVVKDGMLIGRGCADDKSGVVMAACALAMVRDLKLPIQSRLLAFAGANEETGMGDVQSFVAHEANPDICLVPDGSFPCSLGEKSKLIMWAECDTPFTAIRDFRGGLSTNVVLGSVDVILSADQALQAQLAEKIAGRDAYTLTLQDDGTLLLQVKGVGGHASWPEGTVNAGALAAALLADCTALPESDRAILATVRDFVTDPFGIGSGIAHDDPRFGRLSAANGLMEVKDGKLRLSMDTRYGTTLSSEALKEQLRAVWGSRGWSLPSLESREGFHVDDNSPVPGMIQDICREMTGLDRPLFRMAGGTYSHYLKNGFSVGVQTAWAGSQPKMTFPEGHGHVHQPDESLDIDGWMLAIRLLMQILLHCDRLLHPAN